MDAAECAGRQRKAFTIRGQVQGVGFRPFVWRLANELGLTGFALNSSAGVRIEAQGEAARLRAFQDRLLAELPPLARITGFEEHAIPLREDLGFDIRESEAGRGAAILVSPDVAVCGECLADIADPQNRRYGYAFTNCVNCGPRFTITRALPYDRASTVMSCFRLCPDCGAEYADPADRRFHAQPIACPACGPKLWFSDRPDFSEPFFPQNDPDAIKRAADLISSGGILAIKGLGGFQLACDGRNESAVGLLRMRKRRPHKALAVMAQNLTEVRLFCETSPALEKLLIGPEKPITLCPKRKNAPLPLADSISPDSHAIGVMLPYTPLHALLLAQLARAGLESPALVMTSANPAGEPICLGNREALARLAGLADGWLLHDRDILCRVDDSVAQAPALPGVEQDTPVILIRRARGYTPGRIELKDGHAGRVLGAGAELKATFCLTRAADAFPGQHIGDLKSPEIFDFYQESLKHLQNLLEMEPEAIVCDLHPDFISSQFGAGLAEKLGVPLWRLQHHAAHGAAVLAENGVFEPALALCLDGFGLGPAGELWGGELLYLDLTESSWRRLGGLSEIPLPGGEQAAREPWRIAQALGHLSGNSFSLATTDRRKEIIAGMLAAGLSCPGTSSCGRLFDGVAAMLGLCDEITYEGQAPLRLEKMAWQWLGNHNLKEAPPWSCGLKEKDGQFWLDTTPLVADLQDFLARNRDIPFVAAGFHVGLAKGLAELCQAGCAMCGTKLVGLSGGVIQNGILAGLLAQELAGLGLEALFHRHLPPGDASVSLGQAVWGRALLARG